jgi:hypothetical protein
VFQQSSTNKKSSESSSVQSLSSFNDFPTEYTNLCCELSNEQEKEKQIDPKKPWPNTR